MARPDGVAVSIASVSEWNFTPWARRFEAYPVQRRGIGRKFPFAGRELIEIQQKSHQIRGLLAGRRGRTIHRHVAMDSFEKVGHCQGVPLMHERRSVSGGFLRVAFEVVAVAFEALAIVQSFAAISLGICAD
jgi:hypothetical protein